jgi:hypothetical protein
MIRLIKNKKPILICIGFLFLLHHIQAQGNLAYTRQLYQNRELARAKESIDSIILINPDVPEAWGLKAAIYNSISKDAHTKNLVADAKMEAFQALKKAGIADSAHSIALDLYNGYTNDGLTAFNVATGQNSIPLYIEALNGFKNAGLIRSYINTISAGIPALDTVNLYYTAKSAIYADKEEDAIFYCKIIIDNKINKYRAYHDIEIIYKWLVYHYKSKADWPNFIFYIKRSLEAFPESVYYNLLYADRCRQLKDYPGLFEQYRQIFKKESNPNIYRLAYYQDLYNYVYESKAAPEDRKSYQAALLKGLTAYLKQKPADPTANLLMGKYYINQAAVVTREMMMRSITDPHIMNTYKSRVADQFKKSNRYLLSIIKNNKVFPSKYYSEALHLLIANFRLLNMPEEVRKYQALLAATTITMANLLILILLLFNIILIIGLLFYLVIKFSAGKIRFFLKCTNGAKKIVSCLQRQQKSYNCSYV